MSEQKTPRVDSIANPCPCGKPGCTTMLGNMDKLTSLARTLETELTQAREEVERLTKDNAMMLHATGDMCSKCGWRMFIPSIGCLNCEHHRLTKENAELRAKLSQFQSTPPTAPAS
jgi:hypothetical protein